MKKVLFMVNRDFVLYNFRIELVEALLEDNYEVYICLPPGEKVEQMKKMGCKFIPVTIDKRGTNPFRDIKLIKEYKKIFRQVQPDMILMYTTKVNIYAGIVAGKMKNPYLMNISGLGTAVEYESLLQKFMIFLYKMAAKKAQCLFFQNKENQEFFHKHKMFQGKEVLLPGSGVNIKRFSLMEYPKETDGIHFLFIARVIKEKGIEEYLAAAKTIKAEYPSAFFHVLGPCDGEYEDILKEYEERNIIQYHGMVQDTREFLVKSHCTIHPTFYPEGMSNVCLESAACGRPVITTDRSGCRETVEDGVTGYIFPQRDTEALIGKVREFLKLSYEEKKKMGLAGREKMVAEFDRGIVVEEYRKEIE